METKEALKKLHHWCSNCPKAHDFSCSGKDAQRCKERKEEFLKSVRQRERFDTLYNADA